MIWGLGGISSAGSTVVHDSSLWEYRGNRFKDTENHTLAIAGITPNYLFNNSKSHIKRWQLILTQTIIPRLIYWISIIIQT